MEHLSPDAKKVMTAFGAATAPTDREHQEAWTRLQANLREGPVVTRQDIRRHGMRSMWRGLRRGLMVGAFLVIVLLAFLRVIPAMQSDAQLDDVRAQLQDGRPDLAYGLLADHARAFPTRGAAEARMGLVLDSLCAMGRIATATEQLDEYLDQVPSSVHATRTADVCPGQRPPAPPATQAVELPVPSGAAPPVVEMDLDGSGASIEIDEEPMVVHPGESQPTRFFSTLEGPVEPASP